MCGRFTNRLTWREIVALYRLNVPITPERNLPARYNICPTQTIDAVIERAGERELVPMRWGLVPAWWKKSAKEVPSTFNARAETVATKPMFRAAFKRNRCLVPASGYYEWLATPTGKQPSHRAGCCIARDHLIRRAYFLGPSTFVDDLARLAEGRVGRRQRRRRGEPQPVLVVDRDDEGGLAREIEPVEMVGLRLEDHCLCSQAALNDVIAYSRVKR